jgi:hypothetical protein
LPRQLLGLVGRKRSGKDTIARHLHGFTRVAFADALKAAAYDADPVISAGGRDGFRMIRLAQLVDLVGWEDAKDSYPDVVTYLQNFGVSMRDNTDPDIWIKTAMRKATALLNDGADVVITDVRFQNEVEAVRDLGGVVGRVTRPGAPSYGANSGHVSEQVEALDVDFDVENVEGEPAMTAAIVREHVRRHYELPPRWSPEWAGLRPSRQPVTEPF